MPSMTFRFVTECQLTLEGDSYEEAYLKFKDLCHGEMPIASHPKLEVFPPENSEVFFEVDDQEDFSRIEMLKGDFKEDILKNCPAAIAEKIQAHMYH